jgi:predicted acetyltransferase
MSKPRTNPTVAPLVQAQLERAYHVWARSYGLETEADRAALVARARLEDCRGVVEDGELVAVGRLLPLRVTLGDDVVNAGGVAGLATLPEARRRGHIQAMVFDMLREMRERSMVLSTLYPFASAFYRRYGWAICSDVLTVKLPARLLASREREPGRIDEVAGDDVDVLRGLHEQWGRAYNLSVLRDAWWYRHYVHFRDLSTMEPRYTYVFTPPGGDAEGYAVVHFGTEDGAQVLYVRELIATTPRARRALFGLLGDFDSQASTADILLPADDPLRGALASYDDVRIEHDWHMAAMARIVDIAGAFDGAAMPGPDASAVIDIADPHVSDNHGVWHFAVTGGTCRAERTDAPSDGALSIQTLAQLATGYLSPAAAAVAGAPPAIATLVARRAAGRVPYHADFF